MKKQRKIRIDGWGNEDVMNLSTKKTKEGNLKVYTGRYWYRNAPFEFVLTEQKSGNYLFRGTVSAIGNNGKVLIKRGKAKKEIIDKLGDKKINNERFKVRSAIYANIQDENEIWKIVKRAVERLYEDNAGLIADNIYSNTSPDTITIPVALDMYAGQYVALVHRDSNYERQQKIIKRLKNLALKLPNKAMTDFSKKKLQNLCNQKCIGDSILKELKAFWDFCLESGICDGINPIEPVKKRKKSAEAKQRDAMKFCELDGEQVEKLLENCRKNPTGVNIGIALMASGFKPKFIVGLKWNQIIFCKEKDHVNVENYIWERAGATHDYTRPVIPMTALVLREGYRALKDKYKPSEIAEMPVTGNIKNPCKAIDSSILVAEAKRALRKVAMSNKAFAALREEDRTQAAASKILGDTYERMLRERCNLADDSGTLIFLLGQSFGNDSTSNNYTSFTTDAANQRLYYILRSLRPLKKNSKTRMEEHSGDKKIVTCIPETSRHYTVVKAKIVIPPGHEIRLECLHGVQGKYVSHRV